MFHPLEVKPRDRDTFQAEFDVAPIGGAAVIRTSSSPATIERSQRHVEETSERRVLLLIPLDTRLQTSHYGHEAELDPGDFVLLDSFMPSRTVFAESNMSLGVALPHTMLLHHIPDPEAIFGRRVRGGGGFGQLVGAMLRTVWAEIEQGLPAGCGENVAKSLFEVIASAYALEHRVETADSSLTIARRAQIKRYVERHLRDTDLNAQSVAAGLGLSPRYMRMVFAAEGEGIADYIMRRRLEECASQLTSVLWRGRSITDTAFAWGFSSMAHFTRAFKDHFTVTPTAYRRSRAT